MIVNYAQGDATEGHMWFIVAMMACGITSVRTDIKKYNTKDN